MYRRPYSQRNIFHSEHRCKCIEELTKCGPFPLSSKFLQLGKVCRSRSGKSRYPCGHRSRGGRRWGRGRCKTRSTSWHSRGQNRDRTRSDAWLGRRSGSTQVRISWFDYESYSTKELRTKGEDKGTDGRWQWPLIGRDDFFKKREKGGRGKRSEISFDLGWTLLEDTHPRNEQDVCFAASNFCDRDFYFWKHSRLLDKTALFVSSF